MRTRRDILWLLLIAGLGLSVRLALAPSGGHGGDLGINKGWAKSAVELGIARSYSEQLDGNMLPNYPPLSMLIFAGTGHLYRLLVSSSYDATLTTYHIFIKLPGILADSLLIVLLALLMYWERGRRAGFAAGLLYALHPAAIYDSAVWGQTDAIHTLFMVATLAAFAHGRPELGTASFALALLTKLQAIAIAPLVALLLVTAGDWRTVLRSVLAGACVVIPILLPFGVGGELGKVFAVYPASVGYYAALSMGAYNLWGSAFGGAAGASDADPFIGAVSYRAVGIALFALACAASLVVASPLLHRQVRGQRDVSMTLLTGGLLAYAFFLFPTEMHERYLFPLMALGLPVIFLGVPGVLLYILASAGYLLNLVGLLSWSELDRTLFAAAARLGPAIGAAHVALFLLTLATLRHLAGRHPSPAITHA